ncbi:unnamed protein product [Calypogeia fissa]
MWGLPLALRVMGKYLNGENVEEVWEEVLAKLQKAQPPDGRREDELWSLLQLSYNSLKEEEQQMFLDIAVCFHDDDLDMVKRAWTECGWASPHLGLKNLVEKCLVTIDESYSGRELIRMHEVLRALGRSIAGQTRVCFDILNGLPAAWRFDEGTMKAIREVKVLKIGCKTWGWTRSTPNISIHGLHGLEKLKILWLYGVDLYGPPNLLPPNLAFMRIQDGTWTSLHPRLSSQAEGSLPTYAPLGTQHPMLRHLEICSWHIAKDVTDALGELQALEYLQIESQDWAVIPEGFGQLSSLKYLLIQDCRKLRCFLGVIGHLEKLEFLRISCRHSNACLTTPGNHRCLDSPPKIPGNLWPLQQVEVGCWPESNALLDILRQLQSVQRLLVSHCSHCEQSDVRSNLFDQLQFLDSLTTRGLLQYVGQLDLAVFHKDNLVINRWESEHLPNSLGSLRGLIKLTIRSCNSLEILPDSLRELQALQRLSIIQCRVVSVLPYTLGALQALKFLFLDSCESLECIPDTLGLLISLEELKIRRCKGLNALPDSLGGLKSLKSFYLESCNSLHSLPDSLGRLQALEELTIEDCNSLSALPDSLGGLQLLRNFAIGYCQSLKSLPSNIGNLHSLESLELYNFHDQKAFPNTLGNLQALEYLRISHCHGSDILPDTLGKLHALQVLEIDHCNGLRALPDTLGSLQNLEYLGIGYCRSLDILPSTLGKLKSLQVIEFEFCRSLRALPDTLGQLQSLQVFRIESCKSLKSLPSTLGNIHALQCFDIHDCQGLEALPHNLAQKVNALPVFIITSCRSLKTHPGARAELEAQDNRENRMMEEKIACRKWGRGFQVFRSISRRRAL